MRRISLLLTVLFVASWAYAQDWYLSGSVSHTNEVGEFNKSADMMNNLPGGNLSVGYNFTRFGGLRLSFGYNPMSSRFPYSYVKETNKESFGYHMTSGYLDGVISLSEIFMHGHTDRKSSLNLIVGAGAVKGLMFDVFGRNSDYLPSECSFVDQGVINYAFHAGLAGNIRISNALDLSIEGKYAFVQDEFNKIKHGGMFDQYLEVSLGLTWHFWHNYDKSSRNPNVRTIKTKAKEEVIYDLDIPQTEWVPNATSSRTTKTIKAKEVKVKEPKVKKVKEEKVKEEKVKEPKPEKANKVKESKPEKVKKVKEEKVKEPKPEKVKPVKEKVVKEKPVKEKKTNKDEKTDTFVPGKRMQEGIYFIYNFSNVSINQHDELERVAKFLNDNPDARIIIHGYADRDNGNAESNKQLAQQRADAVATKLQKLYAISASRLSISAHATSLEGGVRGEDNIRAVEFEMTR